MTVPAGATPGVQEDPFATGPTWAERPREPQDLRGAMLAFAVVATVLVLLGAPIGIIWAALSPQLDLAAVSEGSETAFTVQLTADLVLGALGVVVGAVAGAVAWLRRPRHGAAVVLGLAVGGVLCALVAARVGYLVQLPGLRAAVRPDLPGETLDLITFRLRLRGVLVVLPLVAVGTFALLTARTPEPV